jgi:hypothetical protein
MPVLSRQSDRCGSVECRIGVSWVRLPEVSFEIELAEACHAACKEGKGCAARAVKS